MKLLAGSILIVLVVLIFGDFGSGAGAFLPEAEPAPLSPPLEIPFPPQKILSGGTHVFQTFNNCAPAALSIALSYHGIYRSQEELASALRPYNNLAGKNDDKSTPPLELAEKAKEYGLLPYFRANGSVEILQKLLAQDLPVVVRTLLYADQDYAHYRVLKGYDLEKGTLLQDDSLQGKDLEYTEKEFLALWKPFNYAYLVLAPRDKQEIVEAILEEEADADVAWRNAAARARKELLGNPQDRSSRFNLAVASYYLGDNEGAVREFEKVEPRLTTHTIWYQIEPIEAYFNLGNYERVFSLSDGILSNSNPAFTELYLLRGESALRLGDTERAKEEFDKAVLYNKNSVRAKEAVASLAAS